MKQLTALIFCAALVLAHPAAAADIAGRVVGITDGDTLTLLTDQKESIRVRLAEIDAPEKGQPYGARAKQALSELCFNQQVTAAYVDTDRYGRTVARIRAVTLDINAEMVKRGAAWVYRKYARDPALLAIEEEARREGRGLWALPESERQPPWEWRALKRSGLPPR